MLKVLQKDGKAILLDASSAILLAKADFHEELVTHYSVVLSDSVYSEVTKNELPGSAEYRRLFREARLQVLSADSLPKRCENDTELQRLNKLDKGERDTICLFRAGKGEFLITDDGSAARFCLEEEIPFVNSLLLLRIFRQAGVIGYDSYLKGFRELLRSGRYSREVVTYARNCPAEKLLYFLP